MVRRMDPESVQARLNARQKRERAVQLRIQSYTWSQIASAVGYASPSAAYQAVVEYFKKYPSPDADQLRQMENEKLDRLEGDMIAILERQHIVVNTKGIVGRYTGRIQRDELGEPMYAEGSDGKLRPVYEIQELQDDDPAIRAASTILQIHKRRAALNGLDMPVKIQLDDGSVDDEIRELVEALVAKGEPQVPAGSNEEVQQ